MLSFNLEDFDFIYAATLQFVQFVSTFIPALSRFRDPMDSKPAQGWNKRSRDTRRDTRRPSKPPWS